MSNSESFLSLCTNDIHSCRKTSSKKPPENVEAAAGLPAHLQRYVIIKLISFISTDENFNSTDPNVYLTRAGSVWPHLPALAWALPLRYRLPLRLPNSPTIPVNVDQTYQPPALMTKKNKTKFQVPSPSLVNPAPTLAVLTTKMKVYFFLSIYLFNLMYPFSRTRRQ